MAAQWFSPGCRRLTLGWCLLALGVAVAGCHEPVSPTAVTAQAVAEEDLEPLWQASLAVLRRHDFEPDRQDRAMGVIETLPTTSRQWGEFWRQDVADAYGVLESSLQTIQRQATVRFVRGESGWTVQVEVQVYRLAVPESQVTSSSSVIRGFSGDLPTTEGRVVRAASDRQRWVSLGRDAAMEDRLLTRILSRAAATKY